MLVNNRTLLIKALVLPVRSFALLILPQQFLMQLVPLCALYPKLRIYNPFSFKVPFLASPPPALRPPRLFISPNFLVSKNRDDEHAPRKLTVAVARHEHVLPVGYASTNLRGGDVL